MTVALSIRLSGAPNAPAHLRGLLAQIIGASVRDIALYAERQVKVAAPKDTSALARSFTTQVRGLTATVSSPIGYAAVMEFGRRPGAPMPPPASLAGWARRHG